MQNCRCLANREPSGPAPASSVASRAAPWGWHLVHRCRPEPDGVAACCFRVLLQQKPHGFIRPRPVATTRTDGRTVLARSQCKDGDADRMTLARRELKRGSTVVRWSCG